MSGEIVNLNKARKARARQDARTEAGANRAKFGRGKLERTAATDAAKRAEHTLDQHRLDRAKDEK